MLGTYALSAGYYDAYYLKAQQVRTLIKAEFDEVLEGVDALIAPTSPSVAFEIGAKTQDPLLMYLNDACTLPVNIAGLPGVSVPCGLSDGLPVGLQVIGRAFDEATVLRIEDAYEQAPGFSGMRATTAHDEGCGSPYVQLGHSQYPIILPPAYSPEGTLEHGRRVVRV